MIVLMFTALVSARFIIETKLSFAFSSCLLVQSVDSCSLRWRFHAIMATTNRIANSKRMANKPSKGP